VDHLDAGRQLEQLSGHVLRGPAACTLLVASPAASGPCGGTRRRQEKSGRSGVPLFNSKIWWIGSGKAPERILDTA